MFEQVYLLGFLIQNESAEKKIPNWSAVAYEHRREREVKAH